MILNDEVDANRMLHTSSIFSSPLLSELRTINFLVRKIESSLEVVNDTRDDEFPELLPSEA